MTLLTDDRRGLPREVMDALLSAATAIDYLCDAPSPPLELLVASRAVHQALIASWVTGPALPDDADVLASTCA
jgi:hypothetical protein